MKYLIFFVFAYSVHSFSQNSIIRISALETGLNETISLPVIANNLNNITAVSLKIETNNTVEFIGIKNPAADFIANIVDGILYVSWFDISLENPFSVQDGVLFEIEGVVKNSGTIEFVKDGCEISDLNGPIESIEYIDGGISTTTGLTDDHVSFPDFQLYQNFPNPFNPATVISFRLFRKERVRIMIYNLSGEIIRNSESEYYPGENTFVFDAEGLSSGLYFYELQTNKQSERRKMLFIK